MANRTIVVGMAATFAGLTALLVVAGIVVNPLLLAVALPFGAATYLLWYHASGRLRERIRREAAAEQNGRTDAWRRARAETNRRDASRSAGGARGRHAGPRARGEGSRRGDPRDRAPRTDTMSKRAAYRTLGVEPSADADAVRTAYRERAKRLHPDRENGDEEGFKRLTEAYEVVKR